MRATLRFLPLRLLAISASVAFPLGAARAAAVVATVDFAREIQPLLASRCLDCHGAEKPKGGLSLASRAAALRGGKSGKPALVAGQPDASPLLARVTTTDADEMMPPKGERLSAAQVTTLRRWIEQGAIWPEDAKHWAYVKPVRPPLPAAAELAAPARNPIDHFVFARLRSEGLTPSAEADPARLLRRVYLDLTGLPPTPAEADAFLADRVPGAYERVVERLLASPHYGEKWARQWLDLARYADSHGFQRDDLHDLWPFRDWVIRALNADLPFDQFTLHQLAGDLLARATGSTNADLFIATGFHRCAPCNVEAGTDQEENRVNQVFDRVNTTASVWLGTTLECAQCHNHKYDPFTQRDYYRLFAFFNNTARETEFTSAKAMAALKFTGPYLSLPPLVSENPARPNDTRPAVAKKKNAPADAPPRTLVMQELESPRPAAILKRGNFLDPAEAVTPGVPVALHPLAAAAGALGEGAAASTPARLSRLDLARWLGDRANPLTARVVVNRWWAEFFGRGLVASLEDFGLKGEPPTHPELLDWLAVEFMEPSPLPPAAVVAAAAPPRPWSMKHLHRLIVTSATYRQSSRLTPALLARDDENKLLARGPRFRLAAELVRDNALAAAGLLQLKLGGPPVYPPQPAGLWGAKIGGEKYNYETSAGDDAWRRGIYTVWRRSSPYPSFVNFDATARTACVIQRSRSNTPLQALTLLNDPVYVEAAAALARRVLREQPTADNDTRLVHAFRLCLTRTPQPAELAALRRLLTDQLAATKSESAAWQAVATALLNLDEMITKG
ncbi:hypothetical protein LBMAG56_10010 [Verrucomicrobiota bacterium]|nr:hypothetical protein LBMAG56_10010 [Verrucomicrobiota bacterium]